MRTSLRSLAILLVVTACASVPPEGDGSPAGGGGGGSNNLITAAEIAESGTTNAYEAVQKLRGNFLSYRGKTTILGNSPSMPTVFVDGVRYGEISSLRNIPTPQIATIRLYRMAEAAQKFGREMTGGVIEVSTKQ